MSSKSIFELMRSLMHSMCIGAAPTPAVLGALLLVVSSCLTPPSDMSDPILTEEEARSVSRTIAAQQFLESGRFESAEIELRKVLEFHQQEAGVLSDLGVALEGQNRLLEASELLEKAARLEPENPIILERLARIWFHRGDVKRASMLYEKVLIALDTVDPFVPVSPSERARVYRDVATFRWLQGAQGEAICASSQAILESRDPVEALRHGRLLFEMERTSNLEEYFTTLTGAQGEIAARAYFDLGMLKLQTGEEQKAKVAFLAALNPGLLPPIERRGAKVFLTLLVSDDLRQSLFSQLKDELLCNDKDRTLERYWPLTLKKYYAEVVREQCPEATD